MPFSSRQGFLDSGTFTPPGANIPDYPQVPVYNQYINYLANLSANSATTIEANISTPLSDLCKATVTHPDGNIYFIPTSVGPTNSNVTYGTLDPSSNTFTTQIFTTATPPTGTTETNTSSRGATLSYIDSKIYQAPEDEPSRMVGVTADSTTVVTREMFAEGTAGGFRSSGDVYYGAVTLPNGDILLLPRQNNDELIRYTPGANIVRRVGQHVPSTDFGWGGMCLAPNGMVYISPQDDNDVIKYDYTNDTTTVIHTIDNAVSRHYTKAIIDNTGNVIFGPHEEENFGHVDTTTDTFSTKTYGITYFTGSPYTNGGCLMPNGNTLITPFGGQLSGPLYEINGAADTGHIIGNITPSAIRGVSYSDNGLVYLPLDDNLPATTNTNVCVVLNTNANTSTISSNTQFTFKLSPVGTGGGA